MKWKYKRFKIDKGYPKVEKSYDHRTETYSYTLSIKGFNRFGRHVTFRKILTITEPVDTMYLLQVTAELVANFLKHR